AEAQCDRTGREGELPIRRLAYEVEGLLDVSRVVHDDRIRHGVAGRDRPSLGCIPCQRGGPADDLREREVRDRVRVDGDGHRGAIDDGETVLLGRGRGGDRVDAGGQGGV